MIIRSRNVFLGALLMVLIGFPVQAEDVATETDKHEMMTTTDKQGLTWEKRQVHDIVGAVAVGCGYTPGVGSHCDPYTGDTNCDVQLPVLCFLDAGLAQPANLDTPSRYRQWSGGIVATTDIVSGNSFKFISDANYFCAQNFGPGWRVAEHHDGWGWSFWAYGNIGENFDGGRFWIDINDQPDGTCWAR